MTVKHSGCGGSHHCHTKNEHTSCCSVSEPVIHLANNPTAQYQRSWQVAGMDCPSCARKIEVALQKIPDVVMTKVLFATEKLVVSFNQPATMDTIETLVKQLGFQAHPIHSPSVKAKRSDTPWFKHKANLRILSLSGFMLFAALVSLWSPEVAQWLFTVTCLVGLVPIASKAWQLTTSGTPFAIETLMTVAALAISP